MAGKIEGLESRFDRIGIWWGIFGPSGVLTTVYAVITHYFSPVAHYGWAAVVLAAIFLALTTLLVLSVFLAAWRYFHPLQASQQEDKRSQDVFFAPDISASELAAELRARIDAFEKQMVIATKQAAAATAAVEKSDLHIAREVASIRQEAQGLSESVKWLERDSTKLIFFATDLVTLEVLDAQIQDGTGVLVPLDSEMDPSVRQERTATVMAYLQRVEVTYRGTHRGILVANVLSDAAAEAERELREMPADKRPTHIDVLDYRRLLMVERQREKILEFLRRQRREKKFEIQRQRPDLLDMLNARSPG